MNGRTDVKSGGICTGYSADSVGIELLGDRIRLVTLLFTVNIVLMLFFQGSADFVRDCFQVY